MVERLRRKETPRSVSPGPEATRPLSWTGLQGTATSPSSPLPPLPQDHLPVALPTRLLCFLGTGSQHAPSAAKQPATGQGKCATREESQPGLGGRGRLGERAAPANLRQADIIQAAGRSGALQRMRGAQPKLWLPLRLRSCREAGELGAALSLLLQNPGCRIWKVSVLPGNKFLHTKATCLHPLCVTGLDQHNLHMISKLKETKQP